VFNKFNMLNRSMPMGFTPLRCFSSMNVPYFSTQQSEGRLTPVDPERCQQDQNYSLFRINHTNQTVVRWNDHTTMAEIKEQLQQQPDGTIKDVHFYTIAGAYIPLCETTQDLNDFPILCQLNGCHVYALNFSYETLVSQVDNELEDEQHYYEFASGVGLKGFQRFFYSNFSHRFINSLPEQNQNYSR
jgi:hypothetical protein